MKPCTIFFGYFLAFWYPTLSHMIVRALSQSLQEILFVMFHLLNQYLLRKAN